MTFVRGGISSASGNKYLMVANGRKEVFLNLAEFNKPLDVSTYTDGDDITMLVKTLAGSPDLYLLDILTVPTPVTKKS